MLCQLGLDGGDVLVKVHLAQVLFETGLLLLFVNPMNASNNDCCRAVWQLFY